MKNIKRISVYSLVLSFIFITFFSAKVSAAQKINKLSLEISADVQADTMIGTEKLEVTAKSSAYEFSGYTVENQGVYWENLSVPRFKITLDADEGYYFNVTKYSDIKLSGAHAQIVSVNRENSASSLSIIISLPVLATQVGKIDSVNLRDDGLLSWGASKGAGAYELRITPSLSNYPSIFISSERTSYNIKSYLDKPASYKVQVRGISAYDTDFAGEWTDSNSLYISSKRAKEIREENEALESAGTWLRDAKGYRFISISGDMMKSAWKRIDREWYYFDDDSYMATGWRLVDNIWYYMDMQSGAMLKNTTTPDGYKVGIDGAWIK